jgi:hypothetical protein
LSEVNDNSRAHSRSSFLRGIAGASGALAVGSIVFGGDIGTSEAAPSAATDRRIFQFALLLEELQSAFYAEAVERGGLSGDLREFAAVVGGHERAHVAFLRRRLGPAAGAAPAFHFGGATSDPSRFAAAAHEIENLGVAAYNGQGANLTAGALTDAAEIVSVEGRHAGWIGALLGEPPAPQTADPGLDANAVMAQLKATGFLG